ncbi:uncharacterized protein BDZ99DRAFT_571289 [Mytilinidion resinicola]|uniref:Uncharacterized protein n=1 Tax=Mytilinidion resinicola TaxID=574789 RepID=A0A6A6YKS0_9PEZI|nr:uncharacterized protein BDZ99DRAFT_571289 [Mytilinidion resinicola]KAF2809472.1 hypothetical protein BDZ99DRAFT_571289 [Mytilinidion resinicola]
MTHDGPNSQEARHFTEGDLNISRYNDAVAAAGDRDPAMRYGLEGATMLPGRARAGFESVAAGWQNFYLATENHNEHAEGLGDLHAGQLHRLNRAVRGEGPGGGRIVAVASKAPSKRPAAAFLGAAKSARRDWDARMLAVSGVSARRAAPAPIPVAAPITVAAPVPSPVSRPVVVSAPAKPKEKPAEPKAPAKKALGGLMQSKWAN